MAYGQHPLHLLRRPNTTSQKPGWQQNRSLAHNEGCCHWTCLQQSVSSACDYWFSCYFPTWSFSYHFRHFFKLIQPVQKPDPVPVSPIVFSLAVFSISDFLVSTIVVENEVDVENQVIKCNLTGNTQTIHIHALVNTRVSGYAFIEETFLRQYHLPFSFLKTPQALEVMDACVIPRPWPSLDCPTQGLYQTLL